MSRGREMWDLAHEWAHDWDGKGIGAGANILYAGGCIYSYGSHFMIARHVRNDKGERAVLFTERTYSNTTAKHIRAVEDAVSHLHLIYVSDPALDKEALFNDWHVQMVNIAHHLEQAKRPGKLVLQIKDVFEQAKRYADFFGYALPAALVDMGAVSSLEQFIEHLQAERKLREAEEAKQAKKQAKLHQQKLKAWRAFETTNFYGRDGWDYLRCNARTCQIETTQQVDIPLETGQSFYRVITDTIARGGCKDCGFLFMDKYPVLEINEAFIEVGCHKITLKEINRFANQQGWR
ncbi:MAG: hypothetical protein ACXVJN_11125 [Mucilaginibacter sp.]